MEGLFVENTIPEVGRRPESAAALIQLQTSQHTPPASEATAPAAGQPAVLSAGDWQSRDRCGSHLPRLQRSGQQAVGHHQPRIGFGNPFIYVDLPALSQFSDAGQFVARPWLRPLERAQGVHHFESH